MILRTRTGGDQVNFPVWGMTSYFWQSINNNFYSFMTNIKNKCISQQENIHQTISITEGKEEPEIKNRITTSQKAKIYR